MVFLYINQSDGGVTWQTPVPVATDGPPVGSPDPHYRFNDRCQMTCDLNPTSPYFNNLYIVEIKDRGWPNPLLQSDIYFSSSPDGGATWTTQVILNGGQSNLGNMPVPAVAPDGTIYVCWMDYNVQTGGVGTIYLDMSTDGGVTWMTTDILVRTVTLPPLNLNGGTDVLAKGAAVIDVSPNNPQEIYIVYAEQVVGTPDEADIFFIRSPDAGNNWTVPLRVNDDFTTNDHVLPWIDVKPNGTIDIAFYGRYDDGDINWRVVMAISTDGGNSFNPNFQVNSSAAPSPFTPSGYWMGEYLGLVVDNTHAYVGFTSSITDINGDVFFAKAENPILDIDFGDAGDANNPTYPTMLANDGARHMLDGATFLGASVDPDPDGQPDGTATGDDNDGNNDDDGIIFNPIVVGGPAQITVTTSVAGYLQGWMDFNTDGDWADPGEQIFIDEYIHFGYTVCLNYLVPVNANLGLTQARFRFSSMPGLTYTGLAQDGEVEDYEVEIIEDPDIKWIQEPCEQLPGLHAHDYIIPPDFYDYIILADDWQCNGGLVTDIHWWGNYESLGSGINYFHLSIHDEDPTGTCLPGTLVWQQNVFFNQVNETATELFNSEGGMIYFYEYYLEIPFEQVEGNTYWLDICAYSYDPTDPAIWRWQESDRSTVSILCPASTMTSTTSWQWIVWPPPEHERYSDMAFIITSEEIEPMDYGDADDGPYPTLLPNGARHLIDGVTFMGASVDSEYNGQPDATATGDDLAGSPDDEDGVTFVNPFVQGQTADIDIDVSIDGFLNAWIDFNGNGDWADPGEQIAADLLLTAPTTTITINVPLTAAIGYTYTRFRFTSYDPAGGLSYVGLAQDGEVEDHEVEIEEIPNKWAQYPNPQLPGLHAHDANNLGNYEAIILADDWECQGGWVTDIHWWGNYEMSGGDELRGAGIEYFHLSIHAHNPTGMCGVPSDPAIWEEDVAVVEHPTGIFNLEGSQIYLYEYILAEPFPQVEGNHYWLDITAHSTDEFDPARWRWQESARSLPPILCGAAEKTYPLPDIWNTIIWANENRSDMAFVITSGPAPLLDLGDANDGPYPTYLLNSGAAHIYDPTIYMGNLIDTELDGIPDPNALGDDLDNLADEDGLSIFTPFSPGGDAWIEIITSSAGYINAWIDYNTDGDWDDPDEHFVNDFYASSNGNHWFLPNVPDNAHIDTTYARFRFSTTGGLDYTGIAPDGEVEDHEIIIEGDLDYGDAPDQALPAYPTLFASDGARHVIVPGIYLGNSTSTSIDAEPEGQQDPNALGDDNDGNDDEDGVILPPILGHGQMTTITVIASVDGYLNGWIDFNSSGDWAEANEHIFIDQPVVAGNNTLNIFVPPTSVTGITYARFRFCTVMGMGLTTTGQAQDGEVEDYEVDINYPYKWIQDPDLTTNGIDVDATNDPFEFFPPLILADDFECTITGPLTRIEIWGSWYHDYMYDWNPYLVTFTLSIHEDIPADQNPLGYSMPGNVLWSRTFTEPEFLAEPYGDPVFFEGWYSPFTGYDPMGDQQCWRYIFFLEQDEIIQQGTPDEPVVYWLDVQAQPISQEPHPDHRFGWKTSPNQWNDNAVWTVGYEPYVGDWNELYYPDGHDWFGQPLDLAFAIYGDENPFILLDLTAMLEGPYDDPNMITDLNSGNLIPFNQPYSDPMAIWHYTGTEVYSTLNPDIVDWVMIELRDATAPINATGITMEDQKAAFIMKDGSIVATDGSSMLKSYATFDDDPYVVVWHRNHLGVLSNSPLNWVAPGVYSYDFTTGSGQAYNNGQKDLGSGVYGMLGGDGLPNGIVGGPDKIIWENHAGTTGYKAADYNLDTQVDNKDKNDIWLPNTGEGTKVP